MHLNLLNPAPAVSASSRRARLMLLLAGLALAVVALGGRPAALPAATTPTTTTPINQIALKVTGQTVFTFDPTFAKALKKSHAKISAAAGATLKGRTATLPINATTVFTLSPASVDIPSTGTLRFKRSGRRPVTVSDISLVINETGLPTLTGIRGKFLKGITGQMLAVLDGRRLLADTSLKVNEQAVR